MLAICISINVPNFAGVLNPSTVVLNSNHDTTVILGIIVIRDAE